MHYIHHLCKCYERRKHSARRENNRQSHSRNTFKNLTTIHRHHQLPLLSFPYSLLSVLYITYSWLRKHCWNQSCADADILPPDSDSVRFCPRLAADLLPASWRLRPQESVDKTGQVMSDWLVMYAGIPQGSYKFVPKGAIDIHHVCRQPASFVHNTQVCRRHHAVRDCC